MPPKHRDVSPFLQLLRDFLLGRKHMTCLRHAENVSARDNPAPNPDPCPTRLSGNSYYTRDPRGQVKRPIDLVEQEKQRLAKEAAEALKAAAAEEAAKNAAKEGKPATPPATPPAPTKTETLSKSCKQEQPKKGKSQTRRKVPILGRVHNWD